MSWATSSQICATKRGLSARSAHRQTGNLPLSYHRVLRHLTLRHADAPGEQISRVVSVIELPPMVRPLAATIADDDFDRLMLRKGLVELIITNLFTPVETGVVLRTRATGEERSCLRAESFDDMREPHTDTAPASLFS